jgi:hypothetical protein
MITAFWDVISCSLGDYRCFRGTCYFCFRVEEFATHSSEILVNFTRLHDITSHKIKILTVTTMRTPNLTFSAEMFNLKTIKLHIMTSQSCILISQVEYLQSGSNKKQSALLTVGHSAVSSHPQSS